MTSFKAQGHNLDSRHPGYLLSDRAARTTCRARRAELEANPKALPAFHGPLRSAFTQTDRHHHLEVQPATADDCQRKVEMSGFLQSRNVRIIRLRTLE